MKLLSELSLIAGTPFVLLWLPIGILIAGLCGCSLRRAAQIGIAPGAALGRWASKHQS